MSSNSRDSPSRVLLPADSLLDSAPDNNDPIQSILSGQFSDMQFNNPTKRIYWGSVRKINLVRASNNPPHTFVDKPTSMCRSTQNLSKNEIFNETKSILLPECSGGIELNFKSGTNAALFKPLQSKTTYRLFTWKRYAILFLVFLFVALFLYSSLFGESLRRVPNVLRSKADIMLNFAIDQIPAMPQRNKNKFFLINKTCSNNFCNITEEKKYSRLSKETEKANKLNWLSQNSTTCDHKFIVLENAVPFEKLFLDNMKKMLCNESKNDSSYFFHNWLHSKLTSTKEDIGQKLRLEFQTLENKAALTSQYFTAEMHRIIEYILKKYSKDRKINETAVDVRNVYETDIVNAFQKLFNDLMLHYEAEKSELVDFASKSAGGKIVSIKQTENYFSLDLKHNHNAPEEAIQPEILPGRCWAFKGSQGVLVIQLAYIVYPTGFVIEHIPVSLSPSGTIDSAPKEFSVWGFMSENDCYGKFFGLYSYDLKGFSHQYFAVQNAYNHLVRFVELRIHSNHGNSKYTCLYRFKVHGRVAKQDFVGTIVF